MSLWDVEWALLHRETFFRAKLGFWFEEEEEEEKNTIVFLRLKGYALSISSTYIRAHIVHSICVGLTEVDNVLRGCSTSNKWDKIIPTRYRWEPGWVLRHLFIYWGRIIGSICKIVRCRHTRTYIFCIVAYWLTLTEATMQSIHRRVDHESKQHYLTSGTVWNKEYSYRHLMSGYNIA